LRALDLTSTALQCDACGYDLRAHAADGKCPECGASVAESRRLAAIPRRPAWRDSDPRWRRRMLAGVWVLVLVPLMAVLEASGWTSRLALPTLFDFKNNPLTIRESFAFEFQTYDHFIFCIGVVLLFSKERNRRTDRLDWTRRWGVITSYGVFLLGIPRFAFITALVMTGLGALCMSMPLRYQPAVTPLFVNLGAGYIYYGPYPGPLVGASFPVFSSIVVMLACVSLFNALRSSGPKVQAALLLAPLFIASLAQLNDIVRYYLGFGSFNTRDTYYPFYFNAQLLVNGFRSLSFRFIMEAAKWSACLAIAIWLSIAQIMAWRRRGIVVPHNPSAE
jgi:predicted RNA-binding Zn-ribbon protein involved in translation (DUF1610 family)